MPRTAWASTSPPRGFEAEAGSTVLVPREGGGSRLLVGLGDGEVDDRALCRAAAAAAKALDHYATAATTLLGDAGRADARGAQALAEGFALGAYRYGEYKSEFEPHELGSVRSSAGTTWPKAWPGGRGWPRRSSWPGTWSMRPAAI